LLNISDIAVSKAEVTVPFLGIKDVKITLSKISNEELMDIREQCIIGQKINPKTKVLEEQLDNEKFLRLYADLVIQGWDGLKGKHLSKLLLVNLPDDMADEAVPATSENKFELMSRSTEVDTFITQVLDDVSIFNRQLTEQNEAK